MSMEWTVAPVMVPAFGMWVDAAEWMPESGKMVLAYYVNDLGNGRTVRAEHAGLNTLPVGDDCEVWDGCTEGPDGTMYCPAGWYESNENEDTHWHIAEAVSHWMQLPPPPNAEMARVQAKNRRMQAALNRVIHETEGPYSGDGRKGFWHGHPGAHATPCVPASECLGCVIEDALHPGPRPTSTRRDSSCG